MKGKDRQKYPIDHTIRLMKFQRVKYKSERGVSIFCSDGELPGWELQWRVYCLS
jgi:hypothetical protein